LTWYKCFTRNRLILDGTNLYDLEKLMMQPRTTTNNNNERRGQSVGRMTFGPRLSAQQEDAPKMPEQKFLQPVILGDYQKSALGDTVIQTQTLSWKKKIRTKKAAWTQ
jgi:hypothetical protein